MNNKSLVLSIMASMMMDDGSAKDIIIPKIGSTKSKFGGHKVKATKGKRHNSQRVRSNRRKK